MTALNRKTKRLIIRPLESKDFQKWQEYYLTLDEAKNTWDKGPKSKDALTKSKFNKVLKSQKDLRNKDQFYDLAVFHKSSGKFIGSVSVMGILRQLTQSCFIGYSLHNNFWGNGYGKEMVKAIIDIAFIDLSLHRVEAGIEVHNRRSIMLARALGLRKEGLKKRAVFLRGEWLDLVMYSATCEEFGIKWKGQLNNRLR